MINTLPEPERLRLLYKCNIRPTGDLIYKVDHPRITKGPLTLEEMIDHTSEREIGIFFPESEYERFVGNWAQYLDLMAVARDNPMIKEQYQQLLMLVNLLK